MKILVNARVLIENRLEGIGWFTHETLRCITLSHPEHTFYFVFDRAWSPAFLFAENVVPVRLPFASRHPLLWHLHFDYAIPYYMQKFRANLFLSPDGWYPVRKKVPGLNVIHDINFHHHPEWLQPRHRRYVTRQFPLFAKASTRLATVSEFSKADLVKHYHLAPESIDVVYNAANRAYRPLDELEKVALRRQYTSGRPYFLFVGALHPRKNILNLLRAFALFKRDGKHPHQLVIVGEKTHWPTDWQAEYAAMPCKDAVVWLGRQGLENLVAITGAAEAMVFVPYFEGFGIPMVEAFASGVPVIGSNTTALPEVAAGAALLVPPDQPDKIAHAMFLLAENISSRQAYIEKGLIRAKDFTWEKSGRLLWNSLLKCQ